MLRRIPSNKSSSSASKGKPNNGVGGEPIVVTMTGGGFGVPTFKPFKTPTLATRQQRVSVLPPRKRTRISYKEDGQGDDKENNYEDEDGKATKKFTMGNKEFGADGVLGGMSALCNRKFQVFDVKPKEETLSRR